MPSSAQATGVHVVHTHACRQNSHMHKLIFFKCKSPTRADEEVLVLDAGMSWLLTRDTGVRQGGGGGGNMPSHALCAANQFLGPTWGKGRTDSRKVVLLTQRVHAYPPRTPLPVSLVLTHPHPEPQSKVQCKRKVRDSEMEQEPGQATHALPPFRDYKFINQLTLWLMMMQSQSPQAALEVRMSLCSM